MPQSVAVFFYGLFMDEDVLRGKGVAPMNTWPARLDGFGLRIGKRATLVAAKSERSYGIVTELTQRDLEILYSAPGLEQYRPETVACTTLAGEPVTALCYNLPAAPAADEANAEYAARLRVVLEKRGSRRSTSTAFADAPHPRSC